MDEVAERFSVSQYKVFSIMRRLGINNSKDVIRDLELGFNKEQDLQFRLEEIVNYYKLDSKFLFYILHKHKREKQSIDGHYNYQYSSQAKPASQRFYDNIVYSARDFYSFEFLSSSALEKLKELVQILEQEIEKDNLGSLRKDLREKFSRKKKRKPYKKKRKFNPPLLTVAKHFNTSHGRLRLVVHKLKLDVSKNILDELSRAFEGQELLVSKLENIVNKKNIPPRLLFKILNKKSNKKELYVVKHSQSSERFYDRVVFRARELEALDFLDIRDLKKTQELVRILEEIKEDDLKILLGKLK